MQRILNIIDWMIDILTLGQYGLEERKEEVKEEEDVDWRNTPGATWVKPR